MTEPVGSDAPATGSPISSSRPTALALVPLAGLTWWVGGYLPWLVAGGRPPRALDGPRIAVPLTGGSIALLVLGALVGGVLAGLLCLVARPGKPWAIAAATLGGVALAASLTAGQAAMVLGDGRAGAFNGDRRVVAGLCSALVVAALVGWTIGAAAATGRPATGLALAVLAGALPYWVRSLAYAATSEVRGGEASRWLGLALLACALTVIGLRPRSRLLWWPVAIVLAWLTGPMITAAGYLEQLLGPGRGLNARRLVDAIRAAIDVFGEAASLDVRPVVPWVLAVGAGAVLAFALDRRAGDQDPDGSGDHRAPGKDGSWAARSS